MFGRVAQACLGLIGDRPNRELRRVALRVTKFRLTGVSAVLCVSLVSTAIGQQQAPSAGAGAVQLPPLPTPMPLPQNSSATIKLPAPLAPTGQTTAGALQVPPAPGAPAALPPNAMQQMMAQGIPTAPFTPEQVQQMPVEARKAEAASLIAKGRLLLEQGQAAVAQQVAVRAESLQVPEGAWEPGTYRPWQLRLDADKAVRDNATRANATAAMMPYGVQQAGGVAMPGPGVAQTAMVGDQPGMVQQVGAIQPAQQPAQLAPVLGNSDGEVLYRRGLEALQAGRRDEAIELFNEAWKHEATLPVEVRRQLKEKLTLMRPAQLPAPNTLADPMRSLNQQAQVTRQKVYSDVTRELAATTEIRTTDPLVALDRIKRLRGDVLNSEVDPVAKQQLLSMVDRALTQQEAWVEQHKAIIAQDVQNAEIKKEIGQELALRRETDVKISEMVNQFNTLMADERYAEAEVIAKQVQELDPKSPIATLMFHKSRVSVREQELARIKADKEMGVYETLREVEASSVPFSDHNPLVFTDAKDWEQINRMRLNRGEQSGNLGPREMEIQRKLTNLVDVKFRNTPLATVLETLSRMTEIPIVIDERALSELRLNRDQPITLELNTQISLRSALQLILKPYDLTYVIRNEVMEITNRDAQRSNTYRETYKVADLVLPIPNFGVDHDLGLTGAMRAAYTMQAHNIQTSAQPVSLTGLANAQNNPAAQIDPSVLAQISPGAPMLGGMGGMGGGGGMPFGNIPNPLQAGGGGAADFDSLMNLIRTTIEPDTWVDNGGQSRMEPYPGNLSLVVSTTSDVHEQIKELLESLRRLQNLQVTIEVRFINLNDNFFERMGVDFDFQIDDNVNRVPPEDEGPSVAIGITQTGLPTADFDIRVDQSLFGGTAPQFGGFGGGATSLGFAILSDIEAFLFLEALQGDTRTNVLQAPKMTLFDGQFASIFDGSQRPFVISVIPVVGDFAVAQQPVIVVLNEGTQLHVQAVVSDDKRFVRLTLVPYFSQIQTVNTFTFEGTSRTTTAQRQQRDTNGDGRVDLNDEQTTNNGETITQGTTVQLPTLASTTVNTTVSVPDGGTILLGGIKRLAEGRTERGVPILSKIPYVNRLFRNVGIGRQASSLMLMVTPRIIIQEEEELAQTGFDSSR